MKKTIIIILLLIIQINSLYALKPTSRCTANILRELGVDINEINDSYYNSVFRQKYLLGYAGIPYPPTPKRQKFKRKDYSHHKITKDKITKERRVKTKMALEVIGQLVRPVQTNIDLDPFHKMTWVFFFGYKRAFNLGYQLRKMKKINMDMSLDQYRAIYRAI